MPDAPAFTSDRLNRQPFAQKLESFLLTEHTFVEGSLVVSLDAPFGAGKTKFLELWTADLAARRKTQGELPRPVTINAWESDYCGDPLVAIIAALIKALEDSASPEKAKGEALRDAAKDVGWFTVGILNGIVSNATGIDPMAAGAVAEEKKAQREEARQPRFNALEVYEQKRKALGALHEKLKDIFGGDSPKAIVCIDELDRCRPDYAISYLEAIKHVFNIHGIVFVLAVDEPQLESATTVLFGPKLVFREYYRKFAHRTVALPKPAEQAMARLTENYVTRYLQKEGLRWSLLPQDRSRDITQLICAYQLTPRQVQEVFRTIGHLCAAKTNGGSLQWGYAVGVLFMATMRIANDAAYRRIGESRFALKDLMPLLAPMHGKKGDVQWWFKILAAGFKKDDLWDAEVGRILNLRNDASAAGNLANAFGQFNRAWDDSADTDHLAEIYRRIEELQTFSQ